MQFGDGKVFFPLNQGFIILLSFHMSSLSAELLGFSLTLLAAFLKHFFFSLHSSSNHVFLGNVFLFLRLFLVLARSISWSRHVNLCAHSVAEETDSSCSFEGCYLVANISV